MLDINQTHMLFLAHHGSEVIRLIPFDPISLTHSLSHQSLKPIASVRRRCKVKYYLQVRKKDKFTILVIYLLAYFFLHFSSLSQKSVQEMQTSDGLMIQQALHWQV